MLVSALWAQNRVALIIGNSNRSQWVGERGVGKAEIRHAFMNPCYDGPIENDGKKNNQYIRIGFDKSGNLLEILYNE